MKIAADLNEVAGDLVIAGDSVRQKLPRSPRSLVERGQRIAVDVDRLERRRTGGPQNAHPTRFVDHLANDLSHRRPLRE